MHTSAPALTPPPHPPLQRPVPCCDVQLEWYKSSFAIKMLKGQVGKRL